MHWHALSVLCLVALIFSSGCSVWPSTNHSRTQRHTPPRWKDTTKPPPLSRAMTVGLERYGNLPTPPNEQLCFYAEIPHDEYANASKDGHESIGSTDDFALYMKYRSIAPAPLRDRSKVPCLLGTVKGMFTLADVVWVDSAEESYDTTNFEIGVERYNPDGMWSFTPAQARLYFCIRLDALAADQSYVRIRFGAHDIESFKVRVEDARRRSLNVVEQPRRICTEESFHWGRRVSFSLLNANGAEVLDGPSWTEVHGKTVQFAEYCSGCLHGMSLDVFGPVPLYDENGDWTEIVERRYYVMGTPEGWWTRTAENGQLISACRYLHGQLVDPGRMWYVTGELFCESRIEGDLILSIGYFKNGMVRSRHSTKYVTGKKHGEICEWWDNGQLRIELHYSNGVLVKPMRRWDRTGKEIPLGQR